MSSYGQENSTGPHAFHGPWQKLRTVSARVVRTPWSGWLSKPVRVATAGQNQTGDFDFGPFDEDVTAMLPGSTIEGSGLVSVGEGRFVGEVSRRG